MCPELKAAYMGAGDLNPHGLQQEGEYCYIEHQPGQKLWLSNTMEGDKFALLCNCNKRHVRYCTLKHANRGATLYCQFCQHDSDWWKGTCKETVPQCEVEAMQALVQTSLDTTTACQVQLPFWHGRIDFYHIPSQTAIQIDGNSHFYGMHHRTKPQQIMIDIECCSKAWKQGARLLRVHHLHSDMAGAIAAATQLPFSSFVMLTVQYKGVSVWHDGQQQPYIEWVAGMLPGSVQDVHAGSNCIVFKPLTL